MVIDSNGNLYGTAESGGTNSDGTVYEVAHGATSISILAKFNNVNGWAPTGGVALDSIGDVFGTTVSNSVGNGTIFEIPHGTTAVTTLASFNFATAGGDPWGALTIDSNGDLFGATQGGGGGAVGTVFEFAQGSSAIIALATFVSPMGQSPESGVTFDSSGNLFGTTVGAGAYGDGTIFEIPSGLSTITTVANFNGSNGSEPAANLILDSNGNLFGTAVYGGNTSPTNSGTVFELAHGSSTITLPLASLTSLTGSGPIGAPWHSMPTATSSER